MSRQWLTEEEIEAGWGGADCSCSTPLVRSTDTSPPEGVKRDPWCPTHGYRDADQERDERIDREMTAAA